jgi:hypothetical protein
VPAGRHVLARSTEAAAPVAASTPARGRGQRATTQWATAPVGGEPEAGPVEAKANPHDRRVLFGRLRRNLETERAAPVAAVPPTPPVVEAVEPAEPAAEPVHSAAWQMTTDAVVTVARHLTDQRWTVPVPAALQWTPQRDLASQASFSSAAPPVPEAEDEDGTSSDWSAPLRPAAGAAEAPTIGVVEDEVTAVSAERLDIQEQALAELNQLSSYRPSAIAESDTLQRRIPAAVPPAAQEIVLPDAD